MPEIEVHAPPVPKARPRLGHGRVFTPRRTELAEHRIREAWLEAGWKPCQGAVYVEIRARVARPLGHLSSARKAVPGQLLPSAPRWPSTRPDLDNLAKTALDALRGVAYLDDAQIVSAYLSKTYVMNGEAPGWIIGVWPMDAHGIHRPTLMPGMNHDG